MKKTFVFRIAVFSIGILLLLNAAEAQDQLVLMNGKIIKGKIVSENELEIYYQRTMKNGSTKEKMMEKYHVFSTIDASGQERIIYEFDEELGNYYTEEEMRMFINGERDAMNNYKTSTAMVFGLLAGSVGTYALKQGVISLGIPIAYTLIASAPQIKIKPEYVTDPNFRNYKSYAEGFENTARSKRVISSLTGSIIGVVVGIVAYQVIEGS